jgi:hypothetical protein
MSGSWRPTPVSSTMPRSSTTAATADAFIEYAYNDRVSLRGMYEWAQPQFEADPPHSLRRQFVNVNFIYGGQLGQFRPFGTVGGGVYLFDRKQNGHVLDGGFSKADANVGGGLEYPLRTFSVKTENERADPTAGTPSWSHQWWGGPTAAGASSSVTTRSRRQADSGAFHLVGDNSENMPLRAGLLNRRRKLLGDQLDDECHARLRPGPTPPHIARVDSGRARSTSY